MIEINKKRIINLLTIVVLLLSYSGIWAQSGCTSMPDPTTYTKVSEEKFDNNSKISKIVGTAHVNGIVVTRTLENDRKQVGTDLGVEYSDGTDAVGDKNPCGNNTRSKHGYPIMDSNRVRILTYEFSQPVTDIELFFAEFGYKQLPGKIDYADIELYYGDTQVPTQLDIRNDCNNGAEIKPGPRLASKSGRVTDVKAGITSNQPFDKMVLRNSNDNTGYGFYVEICFNSIKPRNTSACNPTNINNNFARATTATKTLNGVEVDRILDANQFADIGTASYCGSSVTYPNNLPYMGNTGARKLTYKFKKPVTSAEIFLFAFGESEDTSNPNRYDKVKFSVNGAGTMTLSQTYNCIPTGTTVNSSTGEVKSADNKLITTDVGIKVTSTKPFTEIVLEDKTPSEPLSGRGYVVEICESSIKLADTSTCNPGNINNNFDKAITATKTLNGVEVERILSANQFADIGTASYCGSSVTYPNNLPYMGDTGARKLTYKFNHPVTSAEIFLFAFGEKDKPNADAYDEVKFSVNGGGTMTLSQTYNCMPTGTTVNSSTGKVRSADNKKITTDVGIKVTSTKPFTEIVLDDLTPSGTRSGVGYVVEICASSITKANVNSFITLDATASTLTYQTICEGEAPVYKAKADATAFAATAKFDYILEAKKLGTTNWVAVETKSDVAPGTVHTFTGDALKTTDYNNAEVRVKYVYKNSLFTSVTGAAYSNKVTLTVKDKASITSLTASPTSLNKTGATNIVYTIKGTPGATVTYRLTGDTNDKTVNLNGSGEATVPANGQTAKSIFTILKVAKTGLCSRENLHYKAEVDHEGSSCTSHPAPQFAQAQNAKVTLNGVEVTRTVEGTPYYYPATTYPSYFCTSTIMEGYPTMSDNGFTKIIYTFAKPITKAQVWLSGFGGTKNQTDSVEFSVECTGATPNLSLSVTDCNNTAESALVTKSGNKITSLPQTYFQAMVQVSADKPFTKLVVSRVDANSFKAGGYLVELCPSSIKLPKIAVIQDPTEQKVCEGQTGVTFTANAKMENATGNLNVQWQRTKTPATETSWANAPGTASGTVKADGTGSTTLTLPDIVATTDKDYYYRAQFSYDACGATTTQTSDKAKLSIPQDSDIISIVAPQPSSVTTDDCTLTTNISAQAKIADGYTIRNVPARGGNIFGYFLEYKANNVWQTYRGQQYSNNTSNHPQTLKIVHSQAPVGTTTFRVRYTVEVANGCQYTVTTNEFTFTKNLPAEPAITTPQTVCVSEGKTLGDLTTLSDIKWYDAATGGNEVAATTALNTAGTKNYWATVTAKGCESTRKEITVNVVAKPNVPTVQNKTECPATGNFDMATLVNVPVNHTLKWYAAATGNTTTNSQVDRNKTAKTTYEKWVSLVNNQGCEGDRTKVTYVVDITTAPAITAPTTNLTINCADSAAAINTAVTAWLNTATATVGCGTTPTITNNYAAVKPADFCSTGEIEVTFTVRDAFGVEETTKKKITVNRLIANDDTESVARSTGKDVDVLSNDTRNGQQATKNNVDVVIVNAGSTGATVTADQKIRIPAGTLAPGLHNITYKICEKGTSNCGTQATLAVTITNSTIEANNDTPEELTIPASATFAKTGGADLNVLTNDKLSGVTPTLSQVDIIPVATASGVSIETTTGKVKINANAPAGVYNLTYKLKEKGTSNESGVAKVPVVIKNNFTVTPAPITAIPSTDASTPKDIGNVLNQTRLNGNKPNASQVTITVTQHATPQVAGDPVPSIDTTTGKVLIPSGVKPGTYNIKYQICDKVTGVAQSCKEVTLPITVSGGNTTTTVGDDFSDSPVIRSTSEEVVKKSDGTPVNVLTNDKLGTRTNIDTDVVEIIPAGSSHAGVSIDTATGQIKVAPNTPAGVHEVKYKIKEKGQTTESSEATAKIVVKNKVELDPATIPATVNPPTNSTPKVISNILNKAKINGNKPNATDVVITEPNPAHKDAPSDIVPYVDTTTGDVVVPAGTKPGSHTIKYRVCDKVTGAQECKEATIIIPVTGNTATAVADDFSGNPVERSTSDTFVGGDHPKNVLENDSLGSNGSITTALVTINQTDTTNPGVNIDAATGKIKVAANTPAGEYTVKYTLTEKGGSTPSSEVTVKVVVKNKVELDAATIPSSVTPATDGTDKEIANVLDNAKINGTKPNASEVTITATPDAPGSPKKPYIDTTTGKVKIPSGVAPGTYPITYQVCDKATPATCKQATINVKVVGNNLTPVADDYSSFKVEKSTAEVTVKNASSQEVNVLSNDKLGSRTGLDTNVVTIAQQGTTDSNVNIDLATGKVKVGPGAAAGEHTIRYTLTEIGQTTPSTQVTVMVTVINKVVVNPATIPATVNPSADSTTPKEIGNVLNQTTINGSTPSKDDVTITATPNAPGSPKKPYIDTTTGKVMIPSGVAPGNHTITYEICDKATGSAKTCKTATITVNVASNTIAPEDDNYAAYKIEHPTSQVIVNDGANRLNILSNDKLGTRTGLTTAEVTITQTTTSNNKVNIDTRNGEVDVQAGTPAGVHTVKYKITEIGQPASAVSAEKTVTVVVTNKLVNTTANYSGSPSQNTIPAIGGDVLDNVRINDATSNPNVNDVTVSIVTAATGTTVPFIQTSGADAGKIKIPQGTPAGNYEITYKVCDKAQGAAQSCQTATAKIRVSAKPIVANNDTDNAIVEYNANAAQNVKKSGTDLNVLANDKLGTTTGLNSSSVTIETTQPVTDIEIKADGKVEVAAGKNPGVYELKYKIKEAADPTNVSDEGTVKVVVKNKVTNDPFLTTPVKPSTDKNTPAERINILDKVKLNGSTPSINDVTITQLNGAQPQSPGDKVPELDTTTGKIKVPAGVKPGPYQIKYKVCDKVIGEANSCVEHTITVTVTGNDITAVADNFTAHKVERSNAAAFVNDGTDDVNVLTNDELDGHTGLDTDVVTITQTDTPDKVTVEADGRVKVAADAPAGIYTVKYKITEKGQTTASNEVEVKVSVINKLVLTPSDAVSGNQTPSNSTTPKIIGDVLNGTKLNGAKPTIGTGPNQVTITVTDPADPQVAGDPVPEIDTTTGEVKIPAGVRPGNYPITYKVCDNATPQTCKTSTITVKVVGNDVTATADDYSAHKVEKPATPTFVNNGTDDVNVLSNDKLGNRTGIDTQVVDITQTDATDPKVFIQTSTGKVKVDANTPAGEYTIKYKITEKGQTTASDEKEVKVVVTNKIETDSTNSYGGKPSTTPTPTDAGSVLNKIKINGANPTESQVTIAIDTHATGTTVPYIETSGSDIGKVKIPQGTPEGNYTIVYTICDKAPGAAKSCKQVTATVVVSNNPIVAENDVTDIKEVVFSTAAQTVKKTDNTTLNVLGNDKLDTTIGLNSTLVTIETTDPVADITIKANGEVEVAANKPAGVYELKYKIKESANLANVSEKATVKVVVKNKVEIDPISTTPRKPSTDSTTPAEGISILDKVKRNGTTPTLGTGDDQVTIRVITPATPPQAGDPVPEIDENTGKVKIPSGVKPGAYTIEYKVCDNAPGDAKTCITDTITINITGNDIEAVAEDFSAHKVESPTTDDTYVTDGTNPVNILTNDKLGARTGLDTTVVTITQTDTTSDKVTIDTTTGRVKVAVGAPAGEHVVKYKITEKGQTTASDEKEVKVVVTNKVVSNDATYTGKPATAATPRPIGNVLDNVRFNGATTNPAPNDVTVSVVTPATGTTVPSLITTGTDAGKIVVPQGTPAGDYTIVYKVCDNATGAAQTCKQNTATVKVTGNTIVIPASDPKRVPKTGGPVDVLDNVTIGGDPATKDNVDISIVDDGGTGATVDPATGKINVPNGLAPGEHTITYKVCEKGSTTNCETGTLKVVIPSNIVVNPDDDKVVPNTGGPVDVIDNDTVNGNPATKDTVDVHIVDDGGTGATVDPATGKINVPGGLAPGEYTIRYKVCEKGQTDNCETGTVKVVVPANIVLTPDNDATVPNNGGTVDVLGNDTINGTPATKDNVDISIVDPDGTNASIDPNTGKIVIPNGATPGEHNIRYKVCEKGTNRCQEGTVKVVVAQENIVANADNYQQQFSNTETTAKDATNVEANILTNDQWAARTALNTNTVDIEQTEASSDKVSIDTATGKVKIAAGTPAGTYTLKYTIKPKGETAPVSAPATITVIVKNKVEVSSDEIPGSPSDNDTDREIGNVTSNVKINGQQPTPDKVAIRVIEPATPAEPGLPVPVIDPATGKITVAKNVPPAEYSIKVEVCDKALPPTCVEQTIKIKVRPSQPLEAVNDILNIGTTGGTTKSVLENDKWDAQVGLSTTQVSVQPTLNKTQPQPTFIFMATDGRITVRPGIAPGEYTYYYTIVAKDGSRMSSDAKAFIRVSPYVAAEDTFTIDKPNDGAEDNTSGESVLDNDTLNGQKAKPDDVDITVTEEPASAQGKIELDTTTGKIKVKPGIPVGEHTVKYRICPKGLTTGCIDGEAKVKVQPNLTLNEHTFDKPINSAISETHTDTVLTGSTLDGQPINPSDVTMEIERNGGLDGVKINADGQIVIPKGAPSGTYTIEYKVKSNTYGVEKIGKVTVTVTNDANLVFYNAISTDEGSQNNGFIIKNIELYPDNNLKIFNRYGVLVYEKDGYTNTDPFKGISTGRATVSKDSKLPQGTYYYVLEYTDGQNQKQQKTGWLYIK